MTARLLAAAAGLALPLFAFAADAPGKADVTLEMDGKATRLSHVLVLQSGNEEGLEDGPRLLVYLSDKPIPLQSATGASTMRAQAYAHAAGISAVVLRGDPTGKAADGSASVLAAPGLQPGGFASLSSSQGFSNLRVGGGRAAATVAFGSGATVVKGSFDAPIASTAITQDLKGREAADSAPAKAYIAYMAGLKKGDLQEAGRYATPARMKQIETFRAQAGDAFKGMTKQLPDGATLAKGIRRVIVRDTVASVVQSTKEVNELVKDGDAWKVD
jgi:hypothetical protein